MNVRNHTDQVVGIRLRGTETFAHEQDDGQMGFGPLCGRTLFFDPVSDTDAIASHMSASPGGHEAVETVAFTRTLTRAA